ncbi:hypothetical protein LCGC14_1175640 [marine sediment metagenome]|uniref:Uncharacterized protein n=1 Tax=marine sediment metagenome TaxID=412755 RepID=A0A0F9LNM4_9ZZZZ
MKFDLNWVAKKMIDSGPPLTALNPISKGVHNQLNHLFNRRYRIIGSLNSPFWPVEVKTNLLDAAGAFKKLEVIVGNSEWVQKQSFIRKVIEFRASQQVQCCSHFTNVKRSRRTMTLCFFDFHLMIEA